jgi:hypothetical protein
VALCVQFALNLSPLFNLLAQAEITGVENHEKEGFTEN